MTGADFAFHVFAERNDIAVGNDAHFVGCFDAAFFVFGGVAGFGAGGDVVDLRRHGLESVGFNTEEIAFGLERVQQRIEMRLYGRFAAGDNDIARGVGFQTTQDVKQAHHAEFQIIGITPAARQIAFAQADENGRHARVPALALQALENFNDAVLRIFGGDADFFHTANTAAAASIAGRPCLTSMPLLPEENAPHAAAINTKPRNRIVAP